MKKRGKARRYSREFKIAAVRRVLEGESHGIVARDLGIGGETLWRWKTAFLEKGEEFLRGVGRPAGRPTAPRTEGSQQRRIAELERLVGRQQMEIRFLERALRQVEEPRQETKDDGEAASSKQ